METREKERTIERKREHILYTNTEFLCNDEHGERDTVRARKREKRRTIEKERERYRKYYESVKEREKRKVGKMKVALSKVEKSINELVS